MEKKWKQDTKRIMRHKNQRNKYTTLLHKLRTDQISYIISENINNSYHLSKSLNSMLHRNVSSPLPPHDDETELVHNCSNFFEEKIYKIRTFYSQFIKIRNYSKSTQPMLQHHCKPTACEVVTLDAIACSSVSDLRQPNTI